MKTRTKAKGFDAVAESRKWKERTAKETQAMTREEVMAYFAPEAVSRRFQAASERARQRKVSK